MNKKTLVIGASLNPERYSNKAIKSLVKNDVPTVTIGLREGKVEGVKIEKEKKNFSNIHTVTLYLNSKRQEEYYDYILGLKPSRVIFNPGTENITFIEQLKENNIAVEVACTLVLLATNQF